MNFSSTHSLSHPLACLLRHSLTHSVGELVSHSISEVRSGQVKLGQVSNWLFSACSFACLHDWLLDWIYFLCIGIFGRCLLSCFYQSTHCSVVPQAAGSQEFLLSSVASWEGACASDVIRDLNNYHMDEETGRVEPPRVLTTDVCPGQCAMRGRCVAGTCVCDPGFAGVDCSVRVDNPPVILRIVR